MTAGRNKIIRCLLWCQSFAGGTFAGGIPLFGIRNQTKKTGNLDTAAKLPILALNLIVIVKLFLIAFAKTTRPSRER